MCDTPTSPSGVQGIDNAPLWQRLAVGAAKGAGRGYLQARQPTMAGSMPSLASGGTTNMQSSPLGDLMKSIFKKKMSGGSQSPAGQPASTQAPQGSSTNDDMPNQMPGFGYRPQQGGFGDEDFLRKYFSGGMGGSQGFNA